MFFTELLLLLLIFASRVCPDSYTIELLSKKEYSDCQCNDFFDSSNQPPPRQSLTTYTTVDGRLGIFGGRGYSCNSNSVVGPLNELWEYDSKSRNEWIFLKGDKMIKPYRTVVSSGFHSQNIPPGTFSSSMCNSEKSAFLFGGRVSDIPNRRTNLFWELDLESKNFRVLMNDSPPDHTNPDDVIPYYLGGSSSVFFHTEEKDSVYIFGGGYNNSCDINFIYEYNLELGTWIQASKGGCNQEFSYTQVGEYHDENHPNYLHNAAFFRCGKTTDNLLCVHGGRSDNAIYPTYFVSNQLWMYNISKGMWRLESGTSDGYKDFISLNPGVNDYPGEFSEFNYPSCLFFPSRGYQVNDDLVQIFGFTLVEYNDDFLNVWTYSLNDFNRNGETETTKWGSWKKSYEEKSVKRFVSVWVVGRREVYFGMGNSESSGLFNSLYKYVGWESNCSNRGVVVDMHCACIGGYYGDDCELHNCSGIQFDEIGVCNGKGECVGPQECVCEGKYEGETCSDLKCGIYYDYDERVCSGKGNCTESGVCECRDEYLGDFCDYWMCGLFGWNESGVCNERGNCSAPGVCDCENGYNGSKCENYMCDSYDNKNPLVCSGRGNCTAPGICKCEESYFGDFCQEWYCDMINYERGVCSGRGNCSDPDVCDCQIGYSGKYCQEWMCGNISWNDSTVCNFGGDCIEFNLCTCFEGYVEKEIGNEKEITCEKKVENNQIPWVFMAVLVLLVILCLLCICTSVILSFGLYFMNRKRMDKKEIDDWESSLDGETASMSSKELKEFEKNLGAANLSLKKKETLLEEEKRKFFNYLKKEEDYLLNVDDVKIEIGAIIDHGAKGVIREAYYYLKDNAGVERETKVVIKQIKIERESDKSEIIRETRSLISLQKIPQVVRCYGCYFKDNFGFIILERCISNLKVFARKYLSERKTAQDEVFVMNLLISICEGMKRVHDEGIIHRDLKTENILCNDSFEVRICDFETSRSFNSNNFSLRGTAHNIPPEVVDFFIKEEKGENTSEEKKNIDPRKVDVYAFSFVIFEMYSKEEFMRKILIEEKNSSISTILRIRREKLRPNLESMENAPKGIDELVSCCWEENPKKRKSMEEVLSELKRIKNNFLVKEMGKKI